jgi:hypothetical protein
MMEQIICKNCNTPQRGSGLFCRKCGEKLGPGNIRLGRVRRPGEAGPVAGAVRALFLLAVVGAAAALLWPVLPPAASVDPAADGATFARQLEQAHRLLKERYTNAAAGARAPAVRGVRVTFTEERAIALIIAGWGPVYLTYELTGATVSTAESRLRFQRLRVGHLPIPGPVARWMLGRMVAALGEAEKQVAALLRNAPCAVEPGRLAMRSP